MRPGMMGALMDEYERALNELIEVTNEIDNNKLIERWATDDRFSALQDILKHVCYAGFRYAGSIRKAINKEVLHHPDIDELIENEDKIEADLRSMFNYTLKAVDGLYTLTEKEFYDILMPVWGGQQYHLEQMLEHAIVHILRHRRQIEIILSRTVGV